MVRPSLKLTDNVSSVTETVCANGVEDSAAEDLIPRITQLLLMGNYDLIYYIFG
jgi:hypothetical protein